MIIIGTNNANMDDFKKTGWKLCSFINDKTYLKRLEKSLKIQKQRERLAKE